MRKIIGIPGWNLGENSFGVTKPYLEFFKKYGEIIILTPNAFIPNIDLLVLPGGKDITVGGGDEFSFYNGAPDQFLEHFDKVTLPKYFDTEIPILGICRGMQTLMRHTGVPLVQDIWWGHGRSKDENDTKVHSLLLTESFRHLSAIIKPSDKIGSWHHQGVLANTIKKSSDWELMAYTKDTIGKYDGYDIAEYVQHKTKIIIGIQSHPERNNCVLDDMLIKQLLN